MNSTTNTHVPGHAPGGIHTLRRVILLLLLAILVIIAARGVSGLLELLFETFIPEDPDAPSNDYRIVDAVASTVIAVPLGALVFWPVRRGLRTQGDRHSILWPVYLAGVGTIALIITLSAVIETVWSAIQWDLDASALASALAWGALWAWHARMARANNTAPTRLPDVSAALGTLVALGFAIAAATSLIATVVESAVGDAPIVLMGSAVERWVPMGGDVVALAISAVVWWLHWKRFGVSQLRSFFASFTLVVVAGFAAPAITLAGLAMIIYAILGLTLGIEPFSEPGATVLHRLQDQLADGVGAASVGALVWTIHRRTVTAASADARSAVRLVASGVALAFAASGLGVVVNALLATTTVPLGVPASYSLLYGGLSALTVGAVAWVLIWQPHRQNAQVESTPASFNGRRAYLVVVFGVSALVAVITLLVIAYGILESVLGVPYSSGIVEEVRAPLGILTATALVAIYHFAVWRRNRPATDARAGVNRVTLVTAGDSAALAQALRETTRAKITVITTDAQAVAPVTLDTAVITDAVLASAGEHVLVLALPGRAVEVLAVQD